MKISEFLKVFVLLLLLMFFTGCSSIVVSTPASMSTSLPRVSSTAVLSTTSNILPTTTSNISTEQFGTVKGNIVYTDGTPAGQVGVAIFVQGASVSLQTTFTDDNGNYIFAGIPWGSYEIYQGFGLISASAPYVNVSVDNYQNAILASQITITREMYEINCNGNPLVGNSVAFGQMTFSWQAVPTATNYSITLSSSSCNVTFKTANTNIQWLSSQPGDYSIEIQAFNNYGTLVGTGSDNFTVESPSANSSTLSYISINPSVNQELAVGLTKQFTVIGTYANGATADLTSQVTWSSSNTSIATISSTGLVTAKSDGNTDIVATISGLTDTITLAVGNNIYY
jgi:Bacterial Ig-like domain (group 2)